MKKISAFILIICLFFTVMGYHFIFRMRINEAKKEMFSRLLAQNSPELTVFSLSTEKINELEWENEKEFSLNGQMFDVIEMKSSNGLIILKCMPDHKETALIDQYIKTNGGNNSEKQPWMVMLELATAQFVAPSTVLTLPVEKNISKTFPSFSSKLSSAISPIITPPPRSC
ncbi:MAG: hypothetical protein ACJ749_13135 [Flavisolibacter sp.]